MHACGHDVHMAALAALFRAVRRSEDSLPGPLLALYQPSEETYPSGAEAIVREKVRPERSAPSSRRTSTPRCPGAA